MAGFASMRSRLIAGTDWTTHPHNVLRSADPTSKESTDGRIVLLAMALTAGIVTQGAYYPTGQRIVAALQVLALIAAGRARRWRWSEAGGEVMVATIAISCWFVIRAMLTGHPVAAGGGVALVAGCAAAAVLAGRATPAERHVLGDIVVAVVSMAALPASRGAHHAGRSRNRVRGEGRASSPTPTRRPGCSYLLVGPGRE